MLMRSSTTGSSGTSGGRGGGEGSLSCQDCGNKAKRDCEHMRCRTCCKSRGFHCPTHVKSTWVPVVLRRLRQHHHHHQLLLPSAAATVDHHYRRHHHDHHHHFPDLPLSLSRTSTSLHHHNPPSGLGGGGNLPAEVNSLATFRCIRVSSEDNVVDQYAYQTSINIGGHVFKGILYDQGPTTASCIGGSTGGAESSSATTSDNNHHLHHYQLDITASSAAAAAALPPPSSGGANLLYPPPSLYSAPYNTFLPGMQFFPHPRPN